MDCDGETGLDHDGRFGLMSKGDAQGQSRVN